VLVVAQTVGVWLRNVVSSVALAAMAEAAAGAGEAGSWVVGRAEGTAARRGEGREAGAAMVGCHGEEGLAVRRRGSVAARGEGQGDLEKTEKGDARLGMGGGGGLGQAPRIGMAKGRRARMEGEHHNLETLEKRPRQAGNATLRGERERWRNQRGEFLSMTNHRVCDVRVTVMRVLRRACPGGSGEGRRGTVLPIPFPPPAVLKMYT